MFKDTSVDALMPMEMAEWAETIGVRKAALSFWKLLVLSVLAGAFVALGAMYVALKGKTRKVFQSIKNRRFGKHLRGAHIEKYA